MKCPHCTSEWTVSKAIAETLRNCPFCGSPLAKYREIPEGAICRPKDYRIAKETPLKYSGSPYVHILKEYTGSDRVIAIPGEVTAIDTSVFQNCGLWEVYLPEGLRVIGPSAFKGCHLLKKISLPRSLTGIGAHAFSGCFRLDAIEIPGNVQTVCESAFWFCAELKHVRLCEGVRRIDAKAFGMCINLRKIEIPDTLEEICPGAIICSKDIQVIASDAWKKAHPDLLAQFYYIHAD